MTKVYQNAITLFLIVCPVWIYAQEPPCQPVAEFESLQGAVEWRAGDSRDWQKALRTQSLCAGTTVRTLGNSRATLLLINRTILRLKERSTLTLTAIEKQKPSLIELLQGVLHIFSRTPAEFKVNTPFMNAAIEGTEFLVDVQEQAAQSIVLVYEGHVVAKNDAGELRLKPGQSALGKSGQAPVPYTVVKPRDGVLWTLYFPPVVYVAPQALADDGGWQQALKNSIAAYRQGDLAGAFAAMADQEQSNPDERFFVYRASLYLTVGQVEKARADIETVLAKSPRQSPALALRAIVEVVQDEKDKALRSAQQAVQADAQSSAAWLAMSYARQAKFQLEEATQAVNEAKRIDGKNPIVQARLAEMYLIHGDINRAQKAARISIELNAKNSRAQTMLGFASLTKFDTRSAMRSFQTAVDIDQLGDPLPRLGLGLAFIKRGDVENGRQTLELATSMDPGNALLRSYLGKVYFEEGQAHRAQGQYDIAKDLDPNDPTPLLYQAILLQNGNDSYAAIKALEKSIQLNGNRAATRSRMLLDEDLAVRGAGIGRIYSDMGLDRLPLTLASEALMVDPKNYSAHMLASDTYAALPRHEIARVSELLQAELFQPILTEPIQAQRGEFNLVTLSGLSIASSSLNEYGAMFAKDGMSANSAYTTGTSSTLVAQNAINGITGSSSVNVSQYHYQTDGVRVNGDFTQDIYDVVAKINPTYNISLMLEYRENEVDKGDLTLRLDELEGLPDIRRHDRIATGGFGGVFFRNRPSSIVFYNSVEKLNNDEEVPFFYTGYAKSDASFHELQYLYSGHRKWNFISGINFLEKDYKSVTLSPDFGVDVYAVSDRHFYFYNYMNLTTSSLTVTMGVTHDNYDYDSGEKEQKINPKIGVIWKTSNSVKVRMAAARYIKKDLINETTIEPIHLAGFSQFYDDNLGSEIFQYNLGTDVTFGRGLFAGVWAMYRDVSVPIVTTEVIREDWKESTGVAYLHYAFLRNFILGSEVRLEDFKRRHVSTAPSPYNTRDQAFKLDLQYRVGHYYIRVDGNYIDQKVMGNDAGTGDSFALSNLSVGYGFGKTALFSLQIRNMGDERFVYEDGEFRFNNFVASDKWNKKLVMFSTSFRL